MKRVFLAVSLVLALACCVGPAPAAAQEFFKGKTIRLIVGNSTGGSMDDWGRFLAQYWGRHIPGSPEIIVQNMAGAGTIIAANYIYSVAKPDGLSIGLVNPAIYVDQLLRAKEVKFDWQKFSFIGSPERARLRVVHAHRHALQDARRYAQGERAAAVRRVSD